MQNDDEEKSDDDIATAVQKEIDALKATKPNEWRFKRVESGANNCVFITTTLNEPNQLASNIFSDAYKTGVSKTRYILKMLPVLRTCRADEQNIMKLAQEICPGYFERNVAVSYRIEVKVRNNKISRNVIIPAIGKVVQELNSANHVNLSNPDYVINIDVLRTICCIGVLADYNKFKKYNIQEVCKVVSSSTANTSHKEEANSESGQEVCRVVSSMANTSPKEEDSADTAKAQRTQTHITPQYVVDSNPSVIEADGKVELEPSNID